MITHILTDINYKNLFENWSYFLTPYEHSVDHIKIEYLAECPILTDLEGRKFQIDFVNDKINYHKKKLGINSEPLSRSLGSGKQGKKILDLSAGLGIDAIFLTQLGYQVKALERNPFIFKALDNALNCLNQFQNLNSISNSALEFIFTEALVFLKETKDEFDVCYFDPMFPAKKKSALPKQEMVFFKKLVGTDADSQEIIEYAILSKKFKRIVVKRPSTSDPYISKSIKPAGAILGKMIRYDIYSNT